MTMFREIIESIVSDAATGKISALEAASAIRKAVSDCAPEIKRDCQRMVDRLDASCRRRVRLGGNHQRGLRMKGKR